MTVKITVQIFSTGDEWPEVVFNEIKDFLEIKGFTNIAEGTGDMIEHGGKKWWTAAFERVADFIE